MAPSGSDVSMQWDARFTAEDKCTTLARMHFGDQSLERVALAGTVEQPRR